MTAWAWEGAYVADVDEPCVECWLPHTRERRLAVLRRCVGMEPVEIAAAYPHLWPDVRHGSASQRMLMRDLATLRAEGSR